MLRSASCPECRSFLPLGPGGWKVALPPYHLRCPHCGLALKTDFFYRATWTSNVVFKVLFYLSIPLFIVGFLQGLPEEPDARKWFWACAGTWVIAVVLAWFASFLIYLPAQVVLEVIMKFFPQKTDDASAGIHTSRNRQA